MENFKFFVFSIIVLAVVGLLGYWAVVTIQPGDIHASREKQKELEQKNKELMEEVEQLRSELGILKSEQEVKQLAQQEELAAPSETASGTAFKYQTLINDLQKLITDKVVMKEKSRGTRVGTVQTFLNLYNNTSKKVDNDFGKTTLADVIAFQKAVGLKADGEAGPTTFQKMIDWLKKQG